MARDVVVSVCLVLGCWLMRKRHNCKRSSQRHCCSVQGGGQEHDSDAWDTPGTEQPDQQRRAPAAQQAFKQAGLPSEQKQVATWQQTGILGLRDRGLRNLPAGVTAVGPDAKALDATNNQLSSFPTLTTLINLQRLVLSGNVIETIPGPCLIPLASSLKLLSLDHNQLRALPDEFGLLTRLQKLSLNHNLLLELNASVGKLASLQLLGVSGNLLRALPASLEGCAQLEELDASGNEISGIPPSFGQLRKLKTLDLRNNRVMQVPPSVLLSCAALQTLSLHGNPIKPEALHETEGYWVFEQRRRDKYNKVVAGGASLGPRGMDEGIDRKTERT